MKLIDTIKKLIYLAPCRCGRTYYHCDIEPSEDNIKLTFTPTNKYLFIDPRREDEEFMPERFHAFEKAEHIGIAVGQVEFFLKGKNIDYTISGDSVVELVINSTDIDINDDLTIYTKHKHAHRSFDMDQKVDSVTLQILENKINTFLNSYNGHKILVDDPAVVKKLRALAVYWESTGDMCDGAPQMRAPLILSVPPKEYDLVYYMHMGRLYSDIALTAISAGYQFAYSNTFNYPDPRVKRVQEHLFLDYDSYTIDTVVPRSFMCVGKAKDPTKPYNWIAEDNLYENDIQPSCILVTKDFVQVKEPELV